jgi:hypothetical protein
LTTPDLTRTIAYCGLVCGICVHAAPEHEGCLGCRGGGGDKQCYQRRCCESNGLLGCWECEEFPCEHGYLADAAWRGICIGSIEAIREFGPDAFVARLVSKVGTRMEMGDYRHRDPQEVRDWLAAAEPTSDG